jgi:UDP-glucuronate decarboxylase
MRIFNTYGPRMQPNDGRVVSNFIIQALNNHPITIYGDGLQTRSFCFVDDLVRGMIGLMNTPDSVTGPINCGNPNEFTIRDLAEKVIAMTGSRSRIVHRPLPQDDPRQRRPDISQAQELMRWRPTVMLAEGLQRTITYFDKLQSEDKRVREGRSIVRRRSRSNSKLREPAATRVAVEVSAPSLALGSMDQG